MFNSKCISRPFDAKNPYLAPMILKRELHKAGDRSCMHIEFDISGSKMRYDAGDHLAMYPVNDEDLVTRLSQITNSDLNTVSSHRLLFILIQFLISTVCRYIIFYYLRYFH